MQMLFDPIIADKRRIHTTTICTLWQAPSSAWECSLLEHKPRIFRTFCEVRQEWLTATVGIRGLSRSILQAVQDLSFAHVAVSHQQELEEVVVAFHWAPLAAHLPSEPGGWRCSAGDVGGAPVYLIPLVRAKTMSCYAMNLLCVGLTRSSLCLWGVSYVKNKAGAK